jgi:hypothetical protein
MPDATQTVNRLPLDFILENKGFPQFRHQSCIFRHLFDGSLAFVSLKLT